MKKKFILILLFIVLFVVPFTVFAYDFATTTYIMCGENAHFPAPIAPVSRVAVMLLKIITPVVIVVLGSLDFLKAVMSGKAEDIPKGQKKFLQRLIAGAIVFFVFTIVQFFIQTMAENGNDNSLMSCIDCLINNASSCVETTNPYNLPPQRHPN